jgi:hypothetical protein
MGDELGDIAGDIAGAVAALACEDLKYWRARRSSSTAATSFPLSRRRVRHRRDRPRKLSVTDPPSRAACGSRGRNAIRCGQGRKRSEQPAGAEVVTSG